eukprot:SAG31_NODE_766_length_12239_cov_16.248435_4_plen_749_part_00
MPARATCLQQGVDGTGSTPSLDWPAAIDGIALRSYRTPVGHGRCLFATKDFQRGQQLLRNEPYRAVLANEYISTHCDVTFQQSAKLLRCSRSKFARYSSKKAQLAAWRDGYREECAALVACSPHIPPPTIRLAARILWRRASEKLEQQEKKCWDSFGGVESLEHHWNGWPPEQQQTFAQMAVLVREFMQGSLRLSRKAAGKAASGTLRDDDSADKEEGLPSRKAAGKAASGTLRDDDSADKEEGLPSTREIAQLLARIACNSHVIWDQELRPIGLGLYPLAAMLNHCGQPNSVQTFDGSVFELRAIAPIAAGTELTISYIDLCATQAEQRAVLLAQYHFDICPSIQSSIGSSVSVGTAQIPHSSEKEVKVNVRQKIGDKNVAKCASVRLHADTQVTCMHEDDSMRERLLTEVALHIPSVSDSSTTVTVVSGSIVLMNQQFATVSTFPTAALSAAGTNVLDELLPGLRTAELPPVTAAEAESWGCSFGEVGQEDDDFHIEDEHGGADIYSHSFTQEQTNDEALLKVEIYGAGLCSFFSKLLPIGEVDCNCRGTTTSTTKESQQLEAAAIIQALCDLLWLTQRTVAAKSVPQQLEQLESVCLACDALGATKTWHHSGIPPASLRLGPGHILRARLNSLWLRCALDLQAFSSARQAASVCTPVYLRCYPHGSPVLGHHLAIHARLEQYLGNPKEALTLAESALEHLRVTQNMQHHGIRQSGALALLLQTRDTAELECRQAQIIGKDSQHEQ